MASTNESELCAEVLEHLAEVVDGTARPALVEHLAGCDSCRDLRHEAEEARRLALTAGLDHRPVVALEARVLAALDARGTAGKTAEPVRTAASTKQAEPLGTGAGTQPEKAGEIGSRRANARGRAATRSGTSPRVAVLVTGLSLAAAAAVVALRGAPGGDLGRAGRARSSAW